MVFCILLAWRELFVFWVFCLVLFFCFVRKRHRHGLFCFYCSQAHLKATQRISGHKTLASGTEAGRKPKILKVLFWALKCGWLFPSLPVGIPGMLNRRIIRLSGQEGSDREVFVNQTEEFRQIGCFQSRDCKACSRIASGANLTYVKSLMCHGRTCKKKKQECKN